MRALICVLYSTGVRLGEAVHLRWTDVHWNERCFFIRMSKGRSRWVPFRADLCKELEKYASERRRYVGEDPESFLFCRADGSAYSVLSASCTIRQLMRQAGFKPAKGRLGPRPHDLRHGFAAGSMTPSSRTPKRAPTAQNKWRPLKVDGESLYTLPCNLLMIRLLRLTPHRQRTCQTSGEDAKDAK